MKRSKITMAAGLLVTSLVGSRALAQAVLPPAENYKLRLEAFGWGTTIEGQIQKGFGDTSGTLLDLTDDLGVGNEQTWAGDASIQFKPGLKLRGSYTEIDYSGDVAARQNFVFGEDQYSSGTRRHEHQGQILHRRSRVDFVEAPRVPGDLPRATI
jgi:hypothetical protein